MDIYSLPFPIVRAPDDTSSRLGVWNGHEAVNAAFDRYIDTTYPDLYRNSDHQDLNRCPDFSSRQDAESAMSEDKSFDTSHGITVRNTTWVNTH